MGLAFTPLGLEQNPVAFFGESFSPRNQERILALVSGPGRIPLIFDVREVPERFPPYTVFASFRMEGFGLSEIRNLLGKMGHVRRPPKPHRQQERISPGPGTGFRMAGFHGTGITGQGEEEGGASIPFQRPS
jgi:hypothetical protein